MRKFFSRLLRCEHDPSFRVILLPPDLWAEPRKRLPWPEALGNVLFPFVCVFFLFIAMVLASGVPGVQLAMFLFLLFVNIAMLECQLLTWTVRWGVRHELFGSGHGKAALRCCAPAFRLTRHPPQGAVWYPFGTNW
jgi:hypothetical protein